MGKKYRSDFLSSARRHFYAAETLRNSHRNDVAGYLLGIAAECALKFLMRESGMRPLRDEERRDDPFYAHFESLKTMLRDTAQGRFAGRLTRYAEDSSFMQHWDVAMRYSDGKDIRTAWVEKWYKDAKEIVETME